MKGELREFGSLAKGSQFLLVNPIVDRRSPTFHVEFSLGDKPLKPLAAALPNPFYRADWPKWTPAPFPARVDHGDFAVTMHGWRDSKASGPVPDLAVQFRNTEVFANTGVEFEDATGQRSSFPCLPRRESAWKLRVKVASMDRRVREAQRPVWLEALPPDPGKFSVVDVPPEMARAGVCYLALLNAGPFPLEWQQGLAPTLRSLDSNVSFVLRLMSTSRNITSSSAGDASLRLVAVDRRPCGPGLTHSAFHSYAQASFSDAATEFALERPSYEVRNASGSGFDYRVYDQPVQRPPAGQPVRIRCHWPEVFEVEFTVAPPPDAPGK